MKMASWKETNMKQQKKGTCKKDRKTNEEL